MFWVIQNNIFKEQNHSVLIQTLKEKNIPHVQVKVVPFYDYLLPSEFDSHDYHGSIDGTNEAVIDANGPVIALGGTSISRIATNREWTPGTFLNENFHYNKWKEALGEHLLNHESLVDTFRSIQPKWSTFFIRPCEDTKDFNGSVLSKEEFEKWRNELLENEENYFFIDSDVVASPYQEIEAEYRFFVVDGEIVTYSQYKSGSTLYKTQDIDSSVISYANEMVSLWQPARAFVIDIATTNNGYKVIEINNFNSAGFYAADVVKIIEAVENMKY